MCGVVGIVAVHPVNQLLYNALLLMQHRGQDAAGIATAQGKRIHLSRGTGLGKLKGRMFRIGHLGDCNDLTLVAALAGVEMGLTLAQVRLAGSGVAAAMAHFSATPGA